MKQAIKYNPYFVENRIDDKTGSDYFVVRTAEKRIKSFDTQKEALDYIYNVLV